MKWGAEGFLWLLWLLPLIGAGYAWSGTAARRRLRRFADSKLWGGIVRDARGGWRAAARPAAFLFGVALLAVALARPQTGAHPVEVKRAGVDVMVALDTSYSMAAEDIAPNRLTMAKKEIERLSRALEGNRLGLVAFAGDSSVECPLTMDADTFRLFLGSVTYNAAAAGGTDIAGALRKASAAMQTTEAKSRIIVLITDGEDHEGDPVAAAKAAAAQGIKLYTVGIGGAQAVPIPLRGQRGELLGYKKDRAGNNVFTRLNDVVLRDMAAAGGGAYTASGGGLDISPVIDAIGKEEKGEITDTRFTIYEERFQSPLALALGFFMIGWLL